MKLYEEDVRVPAREGEIRDEVIRDHTALAAAAETGSDRAVEKVLRGDEHPAAGTTAEHALKRLS